MKKLFIAIAAFVLVAQAPVAEAFETKIAVINRAELMSKLPQRTALMEKIKQEFSGRDSELKRLVAALEKDRTDYMNNVATMSEAQATTKKREIQKKMQDLEFKQSTFKEDFEKRGQQEQMALSNVIKNAVDTVAKRNGYNMLLDSQMVLFIDASVPNITQEVIQELTK